VIEDLKNQIIWDNFREGNKKALEIIYEDNYPSLFHYGLKFTPDENLVKDLIHELFIELIDSRDNLSATDNIRFYLLKALRNKLSKHFLSSLKEKANQVVSADFSFVESIETQLIKKEIEEGIRARILASVKKLSEKQQEIIYLRFYNDMSYQMIADIFQVKVQTVRNLMFRAIQSLKEDFEKGELDKQMILFVFTRPLWR
jgi:RNA polymerase sigma factor (sigma-70 family)